MAKTEKPAVADESEDTPIADELEENLTHFDEDDDPLAKAGDFDDDEDWGHVL